MIDHWFISYHDKCLPGSVYNTVTVSRPFDWLLYGERYTRYSIVFFCKIKENRYKQLVRVLPNESV